MRETLAKLFCLLTLVVVVGLSCLFALRHNPSPTSGADASPPAPAAGADLPPPSPEIQIRAREVFVQTGCATCHSVAGIGNPRLPLDRVGATSTPDEIRQWTTGTGEAAAQLGESLRRRKQRYLDLPEADLDALILWLADQR